MPGPSWYTRPVFISSTFKDVQAERDSLRDVVFRDIDDKLKNYRRRLEPIDLRWGVETVETKAQESKELLVLKVCLDEIERCRPFLLVILGDRYGWTPPAHRMQAAIDEKGFVTSVAGKSVTALEIEYGILAAPEQKTRSFFYFRTLTNYGDMPLATRALYSDLHRGVMDSQILTDAEKQALSDLLVARQSGTLLPDDREPLARLIAKDPGVEEGHLLLEALKLRIEQDPGLAGRVHRYQTRWEPTAAPAGRVGVPANWADRVRDDIWGELQEESEKGAAALDPSWQGQERAALDEFVEARSRDFVGREALIEELHTFALSPPSSDAWGLCLHGDPGSGKSALFATLLRALQKDAELGRCLLLAHAGGISLRAGNVDSLLRRWIQELARLLQLKEDDPSQELKTLEEKKNLFAELLSRAATGIRVVCLMDALNQFERSAVARHLTWLPELWPKNARLIATCIAGSESEALGRKKGVSLRELPNLDEREAEAIVRRICKRYHRALNPDVIKPLLGKKQVEGTLSCANPLWLTLAVEQLNLLDEDDFSAADKLVGTPEQKLHTFMLQTVEEFPASVKELYGALYRRAHERFGQRYGIGWIPEMLRLIACSRFGLRDSDLQALLAGIEAQKRGVENGPGFSAEFGANFALQFAAVRRYLGTHLVQRDEMGLWDFVHAQGRKALEDSETRNQESSFQGKIALHLEALPPGDGLRTREIMWHYLRGDLRENAGNYYGSASLGAEETDAATRILAEAVLDGEGKERNAVLDWIGELLTGLDNESTQFFCNKIDFNLEEALRDESEVGTRIALLNHSLKVHERLVEQTPDSADFLRDISISYLKLGDLYLQFGKPPEALRFYQQGLAIAEKLKKNAPGSIVNSRDILVMYSKLGDLQVQLGNPPESLRLYQHGLAIAQELRQSAPDSTEFLRDHSICYERLGDLHLQLGRHSEALRFYQKGLAIAEELRQSAPNSSEYARNLSVGYNKVGYFQLQLGKSTEAMRFFMLGLKIIEDLRQRAPDSANFALNHSVSYEMLGDLHLHQGKLPEALGFFHQCLAIRVELRQRAPDSADFARNLSVTYEKLGDLHLQNGNLPDAQECYQQCLSIRVELRQRAPDSADVSRGISLVYFRLGDLHLRLGKPPESMRYFQQSLAIAEDLRQRAPDSAEFARDLSLTYERLGDMQVNLDNPTEALRFYRKCLAIREELQLRAPDSVDFARGLSLSYERLGDMQLRYEKPSEALRYYQQCHAIREDLRQRAPDSAEFAGDLVVSFYKLANYYGQQKKKEMAIRYWTLFKEAIVYMQQRKMLIDPRLEAIFGRIEKMGI